MSNPKKENWVCETCGEGDQQVMLHFVVWDFHNQTWILNEDSYPAYCPCCGEETRAVRK